MIRRYVEELEILRGWWEKGRPLSVKAVARTKREMQATIISSVIGGSTSDRKVAKVFLEDLLS